MSVDLVVRNALIADGSGGPLAEGDVAVADGRIVSAGASVQAGPGAQELDARGELVCSPGFVDVHTHDDAALIRYPGLEFKVAQGCTTLVIGNCGFSGFPATGVADIESIAGATWPDLDGYRNAVTAAAPHGVFFGWKNFLVMDHPMLTPAQTMTRTSVGDASRLRSWLRNLIARTVPELA